MKRIITTLIALSLVVACLCVPLVVSAESVSGDNSSSSATVVSSLFDYGLTFGYYDDSNANFVRFCSVSSLEYALSDYSFSLEDASVQVSNPIFENSVDFEISYYAGDQKLTVYPYWRLSENDPDLSSVWTWHFTTPFVIPESPVATKLPTAYCSRPSEQSDIRTYVSYSYEYFDGSDWVHQAYLVEHAALGDFNVSLFPARAETRLLRNLVTSIVYEDTFTGTTDIGVNSYSMPYFIGYKNNNINYVDPVAYTIRQYGVIDGSSISWTGFLGNALGGVFGAPLFKIDIFEFTIGGLLGVCVGMGVLMLVLKKFAGG